MQLVDEHILFQDPDTVKKAAQILTKPLPRISAEIAWLPVKNSEQVATICELLKSSEGNFGAADRLRRVQNLLGVGELMPIAKSNVLAAVLSRLPHYSSEEVATWILKLARVSEDIDPEEVRGVINTDRKVSGFPTADLPRVEAGIQNLRGHYRQVMTSVLDNLSTNERAGAMTLLVEPTTHDEKPLPRLIDRLVARYELDSQKLLEEHETKIGRLDEALRLTVDEEPFLDLVFFPLVNQLIQAVKDWHAIAEPIQISRKERGLSHDASLHVAQRVRDMAVYFFNEHDKLDLCQQFIKILQEAFSGIDEISAVLTEDERTLTEIAWQRVRDARRDIERQVEKLWAAADSKRPESILSSTVNQLIQSVKKWKTSVKQIAANYEDRNYFANLARELASDLWHQHANLDFSRQLMKILQEVFAEEGEIAALIAEDIEELERCLERGTRRNIKRHIKKIKGVADADSRPSALNQLANELVELVKKWNCLAQPLDAKYGDFRNHHEEVANSVRELALYLWHQRAKP